MCSKRVRVLVAVPGHTEPVFVCSRSGRVAQGLGRRRQSRPRWLSSRLCHLTAMRCPSLRLSFLFSEMGTTAPPATEKYFETE